MKFMMKLCCCVGLFVLTVSFVRGQNETLSVSLTNELNDTGTTDIITTTSDNKSDSTPTTASSPSPHIPSDPSAVSTAWTEGERSFQGTTGTTSLTEPTVSPSSEAGSQRNETYMEISMATTEAPVMKTASASWVVILLVFIVVLIVVLCIILYFLWRSSKMYSFDLRPHPVSHSTEPIGTFEPVHLDELDHPKDDVTSSQLSPPSVANGTSLPSGDNDLLGENAPQEHADTNGLEAPPTSSTNPSPSVDLSDRISEQSSSMNLIFDVMGEEQQNENNNNPSVCCSDPFVEINLDEPAWSDHLLSYPQQTSSVLPFSPYSFSSSP